MCKVAQVARDDGLRAGLKRSLGQHRIFKADGFARECAVQNGACESPSRVFFFQMGAIAVKADGCRSRAAVGLSR